MFVCPYCGNDNTELIQCCGEMHSEEISNEAYEFLCKDNNLSVEGAVAKAETIGLKAAAAQQYWESLEAADFEDEETGKLTEAGEAKWANFLEQTK